MDVRQEYPKKLYHRDGRMRRVLSIDEHARFPFRDGWAESPAGPFEEITAPVTPAPAAEVTHSEASEPHRRTPARKRTRRE